MKFNSYDELVNTSKEAQKKWRLIPAPKRGEIIREFGNELRNQKADLARVITKEARKIVSGQSSSECMIPSPSTSLPCIDSSISSLI